MRRIEEAKLPGVGVRHDFVTSGGARIGVLVHRSGYRELLLYDEGDPDSCRQTVRLDQEDSHVLAELLGVSPVSEELARLQQSVEGMAIDWLRIVPDWVSGGTTIRDTELRRRTGVSIVAVLRGEETVPSPGPEFKLAGGDTVVVVGTPEAIQRAVTVLREG